jgi:ATP-dependent helicase/DNAse subunit B
MENRILEYGKIKEVKKGGSRMNELQHIFESMPLQEKWIVGQNVRQIYQWIRELALQGVPALNYRVMSFQMLAEEWNQGFENPGQYAHMDERLLAVGEQVSRLQPQLAYYGHVTIGIGWVEALLDAMDELRLIGIEAQTFPFSAFSHPEKAKDLQLLLSAYEDWLIREDKMDAVRVYQRVMMEVDAKPLDNIEIVILDDGFKQMPLVNQFCEFCMVRNARVVSVGSKVADEKKPKLLKAYGDLSEIHQIFETIKSSGISFDQAQIIATKPEQLTRITMIAKHEGIPYSSSLGDAIFALPTARKWIFNTLDLIEESGFWKKIPMTDELEEDVKPGVDALLNRYRGYADRYGDSAFMRDIFHQALTRVRLKGEPRLPGKLYVTDLAGADAMQRSKTFVLGLDHLNSQDGLTDGPVLYDKERNRLGADVVTVQDQKREIAQKRKRDLNRLRGEVYYSYSCFDAVNFTEKFPSPVILNHYTTETCQKQAMACYRIPLNDAINQWEWELASRAFPQELEEAYPKLAAGRFAREQRQSDTFNAYNGQIDWQGQPDEKKAPSSVTKFEKLARSPYLYWIENILEIGREKEPDEPTIWLNALEKGTLLHEIFQAYYEKILPKNQHPNRLRDEQALIAYAHKQIEIVSRVNPPKLPVAKEVFVAEVEQTCRIFLSMEEENLGEDQPVYQELDVSGTLMMENGQTLSLRGKVDRMDQTPEGKYRIYDYKTGKSKSYTQKQYFVHGTRLQHAVYALLVEQAESGHKVESAGYLFPTRRGNGKRIVYSTNGVESREDVITILSLLRDAYAEGCFAQGIIPYANQDRDYPELAEQNPIEKNQKEIYKSIESLREVHAYE